MGKEWIQTVPGGIPLKAIAYHKCGPPDVLQLKEVDTPTPKDDEVLVNIPATSVNADDWDLLTVDILLVCLMGGVAVWPNRRGSNASAVASKPEG